MPSLGLLVMIALVAAPSALCLLAVLVVEVLRRL